MNKKIKSLIVALGLSLLISPSVARADALTDPYIPKIRSGEILPPQYSNNEVSGKNPTKEEWIKSVESQAIGGGMHKLLFM